MEAVGDYLFLLVLDVVLALAIKACFLLAHLHVSVDQRTHVLLQPAARGHCLHRQTSQLAQFDTSAGGQKSA